jgi:hypothetical protein
MYGNYYWMRHAAIRKRAIQNVYDRRNWVPDGGERRIRFEERDADIYLESAYQALPVENGGITT